MERQNPDYWIMTVDGPQTLDRLEAHAINALSINPGDVNAHDKLSLIREIRRLRATETLLQAVIEKMAWPSS